VIYLTPGAHTSKSVAEVEVGQKVVTFLENWNCFNDADEAPENKSISYWYSAARKDQEGIIDFHDSESGGRNRLPKKAVQDIIAHIKFLPKFEPHYLNIFLKE
jgi:hypothetical protein